MKYLLPLALFTLGAAPADQPKSYLLSIVRLPVGARAAESIEAFSISTWGVQFRSVCHIPPGWRIKAGSSLTPNGELSGSGSQGVTWFRQSNPKELEALVLITLYAPVQRDAIGSPDNGVPATFKGTATINSDNGEVQRELTYKNIALTPASRCPSL
jgi:hypothetical protein